METTTHVIRTSKRAKVRDFKAERGVFHAVVAPTNVTYRLSPSQREVIRPGAFHNNRNVIPVFFAHDHASPPVGSTTRVWEEPGEGLNVEGKIYRDSEAGRAVYRALRDGAIRQWSIGFKPMTVRERGDLAEVLKADVLEVSAVLQGANPATETVDVRARDVRTGYGNRRRRGRGRPSTGFGNGDPSAKRAVRIACERAQHRLGVATRQDAFWRLWEDSKGFRRLVARATGA